MKKYLFYFLFNITPALLTLQVSAAMYFSVSNVMDGDIPGTMSFTLNSCNNCIISGEQNQFYFDYTPIADGTTGSPSMTFRLNGQGCLSTSTKSAFDSRYLKPWIASQKPGGDCNPPAYFTAHITVHNIKVPSSGWPGGNITCEWDPDQRGRRPCSAASIYIPPFQPTLSSCTVNTETLTVQMGDIQKTVFTGKGSTSPQKEFNLSLHCNANTKVYTSINGTANTSNTQGVLALAAGANAATGIGVQIIYNNQPIKLGILMHLQDVLTESDISVPFQARYYQLGPVVTSGQANATATFTMKYQ